MILHANNYKKFGSRLGVRPLRLNHMHIDNATEQNMMQHDEKKAGMQAFKPCISTL